LRACRSHFITPPEPIFPAAAICPPDTLYGYFEGFTRAFGTAVSDAEGYAYCEGFVAGTTPGNHLVVVEYCPSDQVIDGVELTDVPANMSAKMFLIGQPDPLALLALSDAGLLLLAITFGGLALCRLRAGSWA